MHAAAVACTQHIGEFRRKLQQQHVTKSAGYQQQQSEQSSINVRWLVSIIVALLVPLHLSERWLLAQKLAPP